MTTNTTTNQIVDIKAEETKLNRVAWVSFISITRKEIKRFLRIWSQTLLPSAITQTLYFLIFGTFVGSQVRAINGISYIGYIVPGLVMMTVITNGYANTVSSFFGAKFQKSIQELLVSPTPNWAIVAGYTAGGVLRGILVGGIVFSISFFFVRPKIYDLLAISVFVFLTALVFSLLGLINGMFAKKFDDVGIVTTFILTPLTYLGGVFYSVDSLPPFFKTLSYFNPILYMVNGFRYGFYGYNGTDINPVYSLWFLVILSICLIYVAISFLNRGVGLKS
jgi:ABC-2 type transport system permease protein